MPSLAPIDVLKRVQIPQQQVTVSGKVSYVSDKGYDHPKYGRAYYIEIKGHQNDVVKFLCKPEQLPSMHSDITVQGNVHISTQLNKVEVVIRGDVITAPKSKASEPETLKKRPQKITLQELIKKHQEHNLLVICTNNGKQDYRLPLKREHINITWREITAKDEFIKPETMLATIQSNLSPRTSALVFLRGGLTSPSNNIWNDPSFINKVIDFNTPFYIGVGHEKTQQLADTVCDESFATPADFGAQLTKTLQKGGVDKLGKVLGIIVGLIVALMVLLIFILW